MYEKEEDVGMNYLGYLKKTIYPLVSRSVFDYFFDKPADEPRGFPEIEDFRIFDELWKGCKMDCLADDILEAMLDGEIDEVKSDSVNAERLAYVEQVRKENPIFSRMDREIADEYLYEMLEEDESYQTFINIMEELIRRDLRFLLMREMVKYT